MKTRPIDETFDDCGTTLKVIEADPQDLCLGCFYDMGFNGCVAGDNAGCCAISNRTDGKNVIFKEIKEDDK